LNKANKPPLCTICTSPSAADSAESRRRRRRRRRSIAASLTTTNPISSQVLGFRVKRIAIKYYSRMYVYIIVLHIFI
jgi:hypothetical protein